MSEPMRIFWLLAQAAERARERSVDQATWWLAGLLITVLALFVIAGIIIFVVRSRTMRTEFTRSSIPLTLAELRRMHRDGEIDDGEMERLKKLVADQAKRDLEAGSGEREE